LEALLETVLSSWPSEIDLSEDGVPEAEAQGHHFLQLSLAWQSAETRFAADPDSAESYMVWAIYGVLHDEAMIAARSGRPAIRPKEIDSARYLFAYERVQMEKTTF